MSESKDFWQFDVLECSSELFALCQEEPRSAMTPEKQIALYANLVRVIRPSLNCLKWTHQDSWKKFLGVDDPAVVVRALNKSTEMKRKAQTLRHVTYRLLTVQSTKDWTSTVQGRVARGKKSHFSSKTNMDIGHGAVHITYSTMSGEKWTAYHHEHLV